MAAITELNHRHSARAHAGAERLLRFFAERKIRLGNTLEESLDRDFIESQLLDSLGIVNLITFVENEFDISFDAEHLVSKEMHSVRGIISLVNTIGSKA